MPAALRPRAGTSDFRPLTEKKLPLKTFAIARGALEEDLGEIDANLQVLNRCRTEACSTQVLLGWLLKNAGQEMERQFEQLISPSGMVHSEFQVLMTMFSHPQGQTHPIDLCARTSISPPNMSRITDVLVNRKLITRTACEEDRRRVILRITEQGEALVREWTTNLAARMHAIFGSFSENDRLHLINLIKRVLVNFRIPNTQY